MSSSADALTGNTTSITMELWRHWDCRGHQGQRIVQVQLHQPQISCHMVSANGVAPDPNNVEAILNMAPSTIITEWSRFMRTMYQVGKFMSHIIKLSQPLRKLLTKNVHLINSIKTHVVSNSNGCSSSAGTHIGSSMHGHSACKEIQGTNQ